jgi:hypothetical protein
LVIKTEKLIFASEAISVTRNMASIKPQLQIFFNVYEDIQKKYNISPTACITCSMDVSNLYTVQKTQKILAQTGRKQVGLWTRAGSVINVIVVCCWNPYGHYFPPALNFPLKNWKNELIYYAPVRKLRIAHETGWITGEVFLQWLKHFSSFAKYSQEERVLLIFDGHSSHKNLYVLSFAKENGIVMLCLTTHCTHGLQPLDVSIYEPLKT